MVNDIDIFKVLEENGFNIKQVVEKYLEEKNMNEQLIEKNQQLKQIIDDLKQEAENEIIEIPAIKDEKSRK